MNISKTLMAIGLAVASMTLGACAGPSASGEASPSAKTISVKVVTPYLANASTKEVIDLFSAEGKKRGWTVSVVDTAGDMSKLNSAFQDAAAEKPDAIVMGMGDPTQVSLGLKAASDAGVPVFAIDAGQADGIMTNVTSDNADLGQKSASALITAIGGKGNVVMLTHDPHPGVRARAAGAKATFEKAGVVVLESKHVNVPGPIDDARKSVQDIMSARGAEVNGIWAGWDEPALGATQALQAANITNVSVVGVDGQDFAVAEIKKGGPFVATVKQDWPAISAKVAELIQEFASNGTKPSEKQFELPGTLITK